MAAASLTACLGGAHSAQESSVFLLCRLCEWHVHLVDLGEVIRQHLLHSTFLFRLLLQRIHLPQKEIAHGVRRFELQWQHPMRGKDTQKHLHPLLELLCAPAPLLSPCSAQRYSGLFTAALSGEKPLRKRGDEADLDDETNKRLDGGEPGDRMRQVEAAREEPTPVERRHAEDERAVWRQWFG
jgi:hypothetical protein